MKFADFETIVKGKYPEAEIFRHGEYAGNKINVAVIFNPNGKVYQYNGTYCEVLNRLKIKAIYKHNLKAVENTLHRYKADNGKPDKFFGMLMDYTEEIKRYETMLKDYTENYIIV